MLRGEWDWIACCGDLDRRLAALETLEKQKLDPAVIKSQAAAAQIENAANARTDVRALVDLTAFAKRLTDVGNPEWLFVSAEVYTAARKALGLE